MPDGAGGEIQHVVVQHHRAGASASTATDAIRDPRVHHLPTFGHHRSTHRECVFRGHAQLRGGPAPAPRWSLPPSVG